MNLKAQGVLFRNGARQSFDDVETTMEDAWPTYMAAPSLLKTSIKRRANLVRSGLPNVLDLLTISMEAGLSFDASMQRVALSDTSLLADEFKKSLNEIRLGKHRGDALTAMADRNNVTELTSFVRATQRQRFRSRTCRPAPRARS